MPNMVLLHSKKENVKLLVVIHNQQRKKIKNVYLNNIKFDFQKRFPNQNRYAQVDTY
jgi:hypothetical protein